MCIAVEFPAVLLDIQTGVVVDEFQQYVQPQESPILSDFCKELTGISQVIGKLQHTSCNSPLDQVYLL